MKYIVEAFGKNTEFLDFEIEIPEGHDERLAGIMGWSSPQRGDEGYDLNAMQIAAIEGLVGRRFYDENHIFQLSCNVIDR